MAIVSNSQNLTAVSYAVGEVIEIRNDATLTIDSTPATRMGTIQCITTGKLRIVNASTTAPIVLTLQDMDNDLRFEAGGILEIRGAAMPLASGTGAAQTWDFSTLFGGVIPQVNYVEVEEAAGSGIYMPWPVIAEDPKFNLDTGLNSTIGGATSAAFTAGNTDAGQVLFWHETNKILRCGNNIQGKAIPNGCAVRVPNIYITNRLLTNQTRSLRLDTQGTPTGGTFTIEISRENGTIMGTTAAIAFNAAAATVDTAIEAITGAGTVTASGGALPTVVDIAWTGDFANERLGVRVVTNSLTGGTNPMPRLYEAAADRLSLIDLSPLGTMDCEWVCFSDKFRLAQDSFKFVRLICVGIGGDAMQLTGSNGAVELDGVCNTRSPFSTARDLQVNSVLGTTSVRRVVSASKQAATGLSLNVIPKLTAADRIVTMLYGQRNNTTNRTAFIQTLPSGLQLTNITIIGAAANFTNLSNVTVVGWKYADGTLNTQNLLQNQSVIITSNCTNVTFANYSDAGPMSPREVIIFTDTASKKIKFLGGTSDLTNNSYSILRMNCDTVEISNFNCTNVRSGAFIDMPTNYFGVGLKAKKVFATFETAQVSPGLDACQGGEYDMVTSTIAGITETFIGVNDFVGGNYTEPSLTPTTGHVTFGPFGAGTGLQLIGAAFTDALGGVSLPMNGDTAEITIPFAMHGITGFQNVAPYLYVDAPGTIANQAVIAAPGVPTGGTFAISVFDAGNTLLGTTPALAFSASVVAIDTALEAIPGVGAGVIVTGTLSGGFQISFPTGQLRIVTIDGSALTGGSEPGVAYAVGRARLQTGTELLGALVTDQFAMRVPGTAWPSYTDLTGANLVSAFSALTGYNAGGSGLEMRIKLTATVDNPLTKFNQISLPTNVDASLWTVHDATVKLNAPSPTDVVRIVKVSDNTVLYSFTGSGEKSFTVGSNFGAEVYFRRENAGGTILMRTLPSTQLLTYGDNGEVDLFYGAEIQLAQAGTLEAIDALIQARLDVAVSTRLSEFTVANLPTLAEIESSSVLAKEATVAAIPKNPLTTSKFLALK